jgi:hypothetical protein
MLFLQSLLEIVYKKNKMSTDRESPVIQTILIKDTNFLQEKAVEATKQEKERKEGKT